MPPQKKGNYFKRKDVFLQHHFFRELLVFGGFRNFRQIVQIDMDLDSEGWHFECYHAISCLGAILHTLNLRHFCLKRCWEGGMLNRSTGKVQNPPKSKYQRLRENPNFTMDPECLLL